MKFPIQGPLFTVKFPKISLAKKKEIIYISLAFFSAIVGLTWVQMLYNDPSIAESYTKTQWKVVLVISFIHVMTQTLIAWKAYLSNPDEKGPDETNTPNPTTTTPS